MCRACGSKALIPVFSLGNQCVSDFHESPQEKSNFIPLELVLCNTKTGCGLLQLRHTVPKELLYKNYWYRSGINQTMKLALSNITNVVELLANFKKNDIVIDVGSNDSTLLHSYKFPNLELVGFEPAKNLMKYAKLEKGTVINDFFSFKAFQRVYGNKKAKAITSIAMFYDLDNPNDFVEDIKNCLESDGIWIIQMNYLGTMLENNAFDNIGHEHLEYYSLNSLENLLTKHGLEIFDIEFNNINGGSFRTYVRHFNSKTKTLSGSEKRLKDARKKESHLKLDKVTTYVNFGKRIRILKEKTYNFILNETKKRKIVGVYGASTKGSTILQYYNLDHNFIKFASERNPDKWRKFIAGTLIPIISEADARLLNPDYLLVLPWSFIDEFIEREKEFLKNGGKFIMPLPKFKIISYNKSRIKS